MYNIWAKQTHNCWRDLPGNKIALELFSEPLKDLLDKILEVKADKRISIQGIKVHPWITQKLPQKYAVTLAGESQDRLLSPHMIRVL
jgi:serine/threonine protein kinase